MAELPLADARAIRKAQAGVIRGHLQSLGINAKAAGLEPLEDYVDPGKPCSCNLKRILRDEGYLDPPTPPVAPAGVQGGKRRTR